MDAPAPSLNDCYAAERTFLAWVRTSLAMMGFGFLIARFAAAGTQTVAGWFGAGIVALGSVTNLVAAIEYRRQLKCFAAAGLRRPLAGVGLAMAAIMAVVGFLMAAYLLAIDRSL